MKKNKIGKEKVIITKEALVKLLEMIAVDNDGDIRYYAIGEMMEHIKNIDLEDIHKITAFLTKEVL